MTWTKPTIAYVVISFMAFLRADYLKFRAPCIHAVSGEEPFSKILGYPRLEAKASPKPGDTQQEGSKGSPASCCPQFLRIPSFRGSPAPGCLSSVATAPVISHG